MLRLRATWRLLCELCDVLSDQSAYLRYLARERIEATPASWAGFLRSRYGGGPRRCC